MKIAQVVSTFPPYRGGMGNVAFSLADYLSRRRYEVIVFTPRRSLSDFDFYSFFKIHHLIPQFVYGNAAVVLQLFFRCYYFDIVHLHFPFIGAGMAVCLLKLIRGRKIKFILHYHMDLVGEGWRKFVFMIYNKIFLRLVIKFADQIIITTFDYAKASNISRFIKRCPNKFQEVTNGVDTELFSPAPKTPTLVRKYDVEHKQVILFVGALDRAHYFKGINYLIKAFQLLKRDDVKLIIVGEGDLRNVYQDLVDSFGLADQVIFTGYVTDIELVKFYNLCDILILPSVDKSEAFGMVLLEAMACQKPVIASDLPGVREVVDKKINGRLVKPKDTQKLAEQIDYLLDHEEERKRYGQAGRRKVEETYSWEKIVQKVIKIYLEI